MILTIKHLKKNIVNSGVSEIIIERFFSESPARMLIHPKYGLKNFEVKDLVIKRLEQRDALQGRLFQISH